MVDTRRIWWGLALSAVFAAGLLGSVVALTFAVAQFQVAPSLGAGALVALASVYFAACGSGAAAMVWGVIE